jgi:hypothetical protein
MNDIKIDDFEQNVIQYRYCYPDCRLLSHNDVSMPSSEFLGRILQKQLTSFANFTAFCTF